MKRLAFFVFTMFIFGGCGGGDRSGGEIAVTLTGTVFQGAQQGNPGTATDVRVTVQGEGSDDIIQNDAGVYSISDVPLGDHTVIAEQPTPQPGFPATFTVTCQINIPDSTTLTVTNDGGGACDEAGPPGSGTGLNITLP